jgi:hypothetical protein
MILFVAGLLTLNIIMYLILSAYHYKYRNRICLFIVVGSIVTSIGLMVLLSYHNEYCDFCPVYSINVPCGEYNLIVQESLDYYNTVCKTSDSVNIPCKEYNDLMRRKYPNYKDRICIEL